MLLKLYMFCHSLMPVYCIHLTFVYRSWEKLFVILTNRCLAFYKDQKHAKTVRIFENSVCILLFFCPYPIILINKWFFINLFDLLLFSYIYVIISLRKVIDYLQVLLSQFNLGWFLCCLGPKDVFPPRTAARPWWVISCRCHGLQQKAQCISA